MKKIIIINHYGITPDMPGATRHYDLAQYFMKKNLYLVEFWMCGYNHHIGKHIKQLKRKIEYSYNDNGVKIVKIKSIPYRNNLIMRQLNIMCFDFITAIKLLLKKDIGIVVLSTPPITFFSAWVCKKRKIKLLVDVEDLWPLFLNDMGMKNILANFYMEKVANYLYNSSSAIEAVSEGMLDFVKKKCKNKDKIMWLSPLGVNTNLYEDETKNDYIAKYIWKDDIKIMYIGAHGKANDIESVLKTIKIFNKKYLGKFEKQVSFIFIGNGENKNKLINLKKNFRLENVFFEDAIASSDVPHVLKNADICLTNLLKIESFKLVRPNKIFQYMAAGKPIICGIWGEAKRIIEESSSGIYVDFTNYRVAAKEIYTFITKYDLKDMGVKGYNYISTHGEREVIFEEFFDNLEKIMKQ